MKVQPSSIIQIWCWCTRSLNDRLLRLIFLTSPRLPLSTPWQFWELFLHRDFFFTFWENRFYILKHFFQHRVRTSKQICLMSLLLFNSFFSLQAGNATDELGISFPFEQLCRVLCVCWAAWSTRLPSLLLCPSSTEVSSASETVLKVTLEGATQHCVFLLSNCSLGDSR